MAEVSDKPKKKKKKGGNKGKKAKSLAVAELPAVSASGQPATPQSRGEDKRKLILTAALELFEAKGYDATAVPQIAKTAGVGTGTIYRYFDTKEALVNALFKHWKGDFNAAVLAPLPEGTSLVDAFSAYWQRMGRYAMVHPRVVRFLELHFHDAYLDEDAQAAEQAFGAVMGRLIEDGQARGMLRPQPVMVAVSLVWGTYLGMLKFAGQGAMGMDPDMFKAAEAAIWKALSAE